MPSALSDATHAHMCVAVMKQRKPGGISMRWHIAHTAGPTTAASRRNSHTAQHAFNQPIVSKHTNITCSSPYSVPRFGRRPASALAHPLQSATPKGIATGSPIRANRPGVLLTNDRPAGRVEVKIACEKAAAEPAIRTKAQGAQTETSSKACCGQTVNLGSRHKSQARPTTAKIHGVSRKRHVLVSEIPS